MNLNYTKHQLQIEAVHKKLVDEEEEYANAVKTHERQTHSVLVCTVAIVALLVVTGLFRMMDENWAQAPTKNAGGGVLDMVFISYGMTTIAKYLMYAGIVVLAAIIIINLRRRLYYTDPVSRDNQSYAQYIVLQEEVIRKLRAEEKQLKQDAEEMERVAKQAALADDKKTFGDTPEVNVFSENGVMEGIRETDGELVLSMEDAWDSIQEEATYESDEK